MMPACTCLGFWIIWWYILRLVSLAVRSAVAGHFLVEQNHKYTANKGLIDPCFRFIFGDVALLLATWRLRPRLDANGVPSAALVMVAIPWFVILAVNVAQMQVEEDIMQVFHVLTDGVGFFSVGFACAYKLPTGVRHVIAILHVAYFMLHIIWPSLVTVPCGFDIIRGAFGTVMMYGFFMVILRVSESSTSDSPRFQVSSSSSSEDSTYLSGTSQTPWHTWTQRVYLIGNGLVIALFFVKSSVKSFTTGGNPDYSDPAVIGLVSGQIIIGGVITISCIGFFFRSCGWQSNDSNRVFQPQRRYELVVQIASCLVPVVGIVFSEALGPDPSVTEHNRFLYCILLAVVYIGGTLGATSPALRSAQLSTSNPHYHPWLYCACMIQLLFAASVMIRGCLEQYNWLNQYVDQGGKCGDDNHQQLEHTSEVLCELVLCYQLLTVLVVRCADRRVWRNEFLLASSEKANHPGTSTPAGALPQAPVQLETVGGPIPVAT